MNKSSTKPIIALAILSFMLALSQYNSANSSLHQPQSSINIATVERSLTAESQFDAPEFNQNAGAATILSTGMVVMGILSLMKGKNFFKPSSTVPRSSSRYSPKSQ